MKSVLLVVMAPEHAPSAASVAIEEAVALELPLLVVAVIDPAVSGRAARSLEETGMVGDKLCQSVRGYVERDLRVRAAEVLEEIRLQATAAGVGVESRIEEGALGEVATCCTDGHEIVTAVVAVEKRSWWARLFTSDADVCRSLRLSHCKIKVVEG